jgi:hypothetical protein
MNELAKVKIRNNELVVSSRANAKGLEKDNKPILVKIREAINGA